MAKPTRQKTIIRGNAKIATKAKFLMWCATPQDDRNPRTAIEFAEENKVHKATLSEWKHDPAFQDEVIALTKQWAREFMPTAIRALAMGVAKNKRGQDFKVLAQYVEGWIPKEGVEEGLNSDASAQLEDLRTTLRDMITAVRKSK